MIANVKITKNYITKPVLNTKLLQLRGYNFCMLNLTEHDIYLLLIKIKCWKTKPSLAFKLSCYVFIMLINVEMPTLVGVLTFISMSMIISCSVEMSIKCFLTSGPDRFANCILVDTCVSLYLTLKAPITTAAEDKFLRHFYKFLKKKE